MKYETTEEMVMRVFNKGEVPYRCARIETWIEGDNYPRQVGYIRVPEDIYNSVVEFIESL